jgi:hypothetical protein
MLRCTSFDTKNVKSSDWNIVDVQRQNFKRQGGIAFGFPNVTQLGQVLTEKFAGYFSGKYKPPSGAKPSSKISQNCLRSA